jgi:hypothetical protein
MLGVDLAGEVEPVGSAVTEFNALWFAMLACSVTGVGKGLMSTTRSWPSRAP